VEVKNQGSRRRIVGKEENPRKEFRANARRINALVSDVYFRIYGSSRERVIRREPE